MVEDHSHDALAAELRRRVAESGVLEPELRRALLDDDHIPEPYVELASLIRGESFRVTDEQVAAVRMAGGSERAAFEVILSASIGAGLRRWEAAVRAITEATDASA